MFFLSGPGIIQTQNITNMCQAYRTLCQNGRCIPMPSIGYRCECNMGFKLNDRGECFGKSVPPASHQEAAEKGGRWFMSFTFVPQMPMSVREARVLTETV